MSGAGGPPGNLATSTAEEHSARSRSHFAHTGAGLGQQLGAVDCVRTRPGGYLAEIEPDQLDLLRFRALVGSGDFGAASSLRPSSHSRLAQPPKESSLSSSWRASARASADID